MKYRLYLLYKHEWGELEITSKGKCDVRGHWIYYLQGEDNGHKVSGNVAKDVWDRFDVPITESKIRPRRKRDDYKKALDMEVYHHGKIRKTYKKVLNNEIEQWLAEKYNITENDINKEKDE